MTASFTRRAATTGLLATIGQNTIGEGAHAAVPSAPRRVVSIGSCLDVVLMEVADRRQIAALSHFSRDPDTSTVAERARTYPFTHESAEEVVALSPDLVLASKRSGMQTRAALKRNGLRVEEFEVPDHVAASLEQVRKIAELVGAPARGEIVVRRIETALAAAAPKPGQPRLKALIYQANGFAAGSKTLVGEMMERCGFDNVASRYGLKKWGNIPLERVLADPPQVLLAGERSPGAPNWAERIISHPALESLEPQTYRAVFNQRLLYCGGPVLIETTTALNRAREGALAWAARRQST